jgi:metallo-beta-lactamase family protein
LNPSKQLLMINTIHKYSVTHAGPLTGSKYLLEALGKTLMIDFGAYQELKKLTELNWHRLPVKIGNIDLVLLPHVQADLRRFLPGLMKIGFAGRILGAAPVLKLAKNGPEEYGEAREETAFWTGRENYWAQRPFYDPQEIETTLYHFKEKTEGVWITLDSNIRLRFQYDGRSFIELEVSGRRLVFSGEGEWDEEHPFFNSDQAERADALPPDLGVFQAFDLAQSPRSVPESSFWLG